MDQGQIDAPLTEEDKELLTECLVRAGYLDSEDYLYTPSNLRGSQDRHDLSALLQSGFGTRVRALGTGTGGPDPVFQPIGGMMEIPLAFQRAIGERITFRADVQTIRQTEDGVRVMSGTREPAKNERRPLTIAFAACRCPSCRESTLTCRPRWPRP